jgi:AcrR family transcriptional regulator
MPRTRNDPRRELTRVALLEAAEALFAEKGVDNVTLRQIGEAVGSDNNAVVSYYFGSKPGLLRAIYDYRIPALEERRSELLAQADQAGLGRDVLTLIYALYRPVLETRNNKGKPTYAGFLASIAHYTAFSTKEPSRAYPSTREIADRLRSLQALSEEVFWERQRLVSMMMIDAIQQTVRVQQRRAHSDEAEAVFADALQMAAAAFCAPLGSSDALRSVQERLGEKAPRKSAKRPAAAS